MLLKRVILEMEIQITMHFICVEEIDIYIANINFHFHVGYYLDQCPTQTLLILILN